MTAGVTRMHLFENACGADGEDMEPTTRDERRLLDIRYQISDLGRRDAFNLGIRRDALVRLETVIARRIVDRAAATPSSSPAVSSSGRR